MATYPHDDQVPFFYAIIKEGCRRRGKTASPGTAGLLHLFYSTLFYSDGTFSMIPMSGTPRIKKPINDSNALGLVEETGNHVVLRPEELPLGYLSSQ